MAARAPDRRAERPPLVLVCASLGPGGAERVITTLANAWAVRGERVTMVTLSDDVADFFSLDAAIARVRVHVRGSGAYAAARRVGALHAVLRDMPGARVLSFGLDTNVTAIVAAMGTGAHVVVSERTDPRAFPGAAPWRSLRRVAYPRAAAVVVQSAELLPWARSMTPRGAAIPNPVRPVPEFSPRHDLPDRFLLAVGRLAPEKGFDLLLRALALVSGPAREWELFVAGDGAERTALRALAESLGVATRVRWLGTVDEPRALMSAASMFVLPSRVEGFPNALLEAMSVGTAVVSFDCPSGPRQLVTTDVDGVLVASGDERALASAISRLGADDALRASLGARARERSADFSIERILPQWGAVLALPARGAGRHGG